MGFAEYDDLEVETRGPKRTLQKLLALSAVAAVVVMGSTLAANINLGSSGPIEFGQGVLSTTACSGNTALTIVPKAEFTNTSGAGAFYFKSITVKDIPVGCQGSDFILNAYGDTSTAPLELFNTTSTSATIYDNAGTFQAGLNSAGMTVSSGSDSFTVTFTNPVAVTSAVYKITIQSGAHAVSACFSTGACTVGEEGPGGGIIVYTSVGGFNCGPTWSDTCHNLEAAPLNWNGGSNDFIWANVAYQGQFVGGSTVARSLTSDELGRGYMNSIAIVNEGNDATTAAGKARAYTGGGKTDWYLPSPGDWQVMSSYLTSTDLPMGLYWLSSEKQTSPVRAFWGRPDQPSFLNYDVKGGVHAIRPVRAF